MLVLEFSFFNILESNFSVAMKINPKVILIILCAIGLIVQVTEVTKSYVEYRIRRVTVHKFPHSINPPAISICFDISKVIPIEVASTFNNTNDNYWWTDYNRFLSRTPLSDLFELTPSADQALKNRTGCAIRFPTEFSMSYLNKKFCHRYFRIQKYIHRSFICYKFIPDTGLGRSEDGLKDDSIGKESKMGTRKNGSKKSVDEGMDNGQQDVKNETNRWTIGGQESSVEYNLAPVEIGVLYVLYLSLESFGKVDGIMAYVHGPETDHFEDSFFARENAVTLSDTTGNIGMISFREILSKRLEAPYPSNCVNMKNGVSVTSLFAKLMNDQSIKRLNKACGFTQLFQGKYYSNYSLITDDDYKNETFRKIFNQIMREKTRFYQRYSCEIQVYLSSMTTKSIETTNNSDYRLIVQVSWPSLHGTKMHDEPLQTILDYLIYIGSSLGFWFGFTVLSFVSDIVSGFRSLLNTAKSDQNSKPRTENDSKIRLELVTKWKKKGFDQIERMGQSRKHEMEIEMMKKNQEANKRLMIKLITESKEMKESLLLIQNWIFETKSLKS